MKLRILVSVTLLMGMYGCGGSDIKVAPAEGTIYMDGKPLANVHVVFQPIGSQKNPNPGRGSYAASDANGKFVLQYDGEKPGAVIGNHRVAITTIFKGENKKVDPNTGSPDGEPAGGNEMIPSEYNDRSKLEVTIPPEGKKDIELRLKSK